MRNCRVAIWLAMTSAFLVLFVGCEEDRAGKDPLLGDVTIHGRVKDFRGGRAQFRAVDRSERGMLVAFACSITDLLIAPAYAAVEGVVVGIKGSGLSTTTDRNGFFRLRQVHAGQVTLQLRHGGVVAEIAVLAKSGAVISLGDLRVSEQGAVMLTTASSKEVTAKAERPMPEKESEEGGPSVLPGTIGPTDDGGSNGGTSIEVSGGVDEFQLNETMPEEMQKPSGQ